jgi:ribonuclease P protein component
VLIVTAPATDPSLPASSARDGEPHRLPRAQRVRKRPEFLRIQDSPARVGTRHLLFLLAPRADDGPPRLGVVASRKVGNAVARNRAKRLVREAFRLHQEALPRGVDLVVIVRPGTPLLRLADVTAEVIQAAPTAARRARDLRSGKLVMPAAPRGPRPDGENPR